VTSVCNFKQSFQAAFQAQSSETHRLSNVCLSTKIHGRGINLLERQKHGLHAAFSSSPSITTAGTSLELVQTSVGGKGARASCIHLVAPQRNQQR